MALKQWRVTVNGVSYRIGAATPVTAATRTMVRLHPKPEHMAAGLTWTIVVKPLTEGARA